MDYYIEPDDEFTHEVNEVKRLLLSRDSNNEIDAVTKILKSIAYPVNREWRINYFLKSDIIELLCHSTSTTNLALLQLIFKCILQFLESKKFFNHHATLALEYILRTLHATFNIDEEKETFTYGLELISGVISRLRLHDGVFLKDVCNISYVIDLLEKIFMNNEKPSVIFVGTELICSILQTKDFHTFKETLVNIVSLALKSLLKILENDLKEEVIIITAEIINNTLRFITNDDGDIYASNALEDLVLNIYSVLKDIFVPVLLDEEFCRTDLKLLGAILNVLLSFYIPHKKKLALEFSVFLISKGFLGFLSLVERKALLPSDEDLPILARSIIYKVLVCASHHFLGNENWNYLLSQGLKVLPLGSSYSTICFKGNSMIVPIASIVYNYFTLIKSPSPSVDLQFLQDMCKVVLHMTEKPSSPLIKAIWFNFVVGHLCMVEAYPESKVAMMKIIHYLGTSDIREIYTHHPAILYWAFCDYVIPRELQAQIIALWVDQSESTVRLIQLMKINKDSCLVTMESMVWCKKQISMKIDKVLNTIVQEDSGIGEILNEHAWSILPTFLAKYSSEADSISYESVANLIKYCCDFVPLNLEETMIMRILGLLPISFMKYFNETYGNLDAKLLVLKEEDESAVIYSFNLTSCLLYIGIKRNDRRVADTLLNHENFMNSIAFFLESENENIIVAVMNLLKFFILNLKKSVYRGSRVIQLEGMKLLKCLQGGIQMCKAVLDFLAHYLEIISGNSATVVVQIPPPTALQLRALYLQIHMICSKSDECTASCCWRCLRKLLELSEGVGLQEHLSMLPYSPMLLLRARPTSSAWEEVVKFFSAWVKFVPLNSPRSLAVSTAWQVVQHFAGKIDKSKLSKDFLDELNKTTLFTKPLTIQMDEDVKDD